MDLLRRESVFILFLLGFLVGAEAVSPSFHPPQDSPRDRLFNEGWVFHRGDAEGAQAVDFDDEAWRAVNLPHDWSVEPIPQEAMASADVIHPIDGTWLFKEGDKDAYAEPSLDTAKWQAVKLPAVMADFKPATTRWFRRDVELTAEQAKNGVIFELGRIDDCDEFYVNGKKIGDTGVMPKNQPQGHCIPAWQQNRNYKTPASALNPGKNLLAICVYNDKGPGGIRRATKTNAHATETIQKVVGPFSRTAIGGTHSGYTVGGTGWYRKHFAVEDLTQHRTIRFGAVMMNSDVWINGHHLGFWPYGYTSFYYDLTPHLKKGDNVIAVRVRNEGVTSRWYPGSGIYRNVWLTTTDATRVRPWGVWARTLSADEAVAKVEVDVELEGPLDDTQVNVVLLDADGNESGAATASVKSEKTTLSFTVKNPRLWNLENPHLYTARVMVMKHGKTMDQFDQAVGIRTIRFSPDNGFELNGKTINMLGGCVHHDNGLIGARAPARAEIRKMEILKQEGYNAVRAAHNPMSDAFYDACDRLGLLVMDEVFDVWNIHKTPQDYGAEAWLKGREKDIEHWLRRTRNHPSIVIRSLGNEIGNKRQDNPESVIQDLKDLLDIARPIDSTRPYTGGSARISENTAFMGLYDVAGYNYREKLALQHHQEFPQWTMIGTESNPSERDQFRTWQFVQEHSWFTGCFVWSAFEYIGESWSGWVGFKGEEAGWPSYAAACGLIDISGFSKGGQVYRRVMAGASPIEINVLEPLPNGKEYGRKGWSWPNEYPYWGWDGFEGKPMEVRVISYAPEMRLLLNGKEVGRKQRDPNRLHVSFRVPYEPGELVAEGLEDGKVICSTRLESPGKPVALRIVSDRNPITQHNNDRAYVSVEVVDAKGQLVMQGRHRIQIRLSGAGEIEGSGSGSHKDIYSFGNPDRIDTWRGRAMAIIRPTAEGIIQIEATSEQFDTTQLAVEVRL